MARELDHCVSHLPQGKKLKSRHKVNFPSQVVINDHLVLLVLISYFKRPNHSQYRDYVFRRYLVTLKPSNLNFHCHFLLSHFHFSLLSIPLRIPPLGQLPILQMLFHSYHLLSLGLFVFEPQNGHHLA